MKNSNVDLRPMHTAPKTGEFILLYGDSGYSTFPYRIMVCRWVKGYRDFWINHANDAFTDGGPEPIFWTPLQIDPQVFQTTDLKPIEGGGHCFTFLLHHKHPKNYVKVMKPMAAAREEMVNRFGTKWGFCHPASMEKEIISWGLTELK